MLKTKKGTHSSIKHIIMKLLIVTVVEEFEKDVLRLFREAKIENFSGSDIDGYKDHASSIRSKSWFPSEKGGIHSIMFFSFTTPENIENLFGLIANFNKDLETNNSIKAVTVPIENFI